MSVRVYRNGKENKETNGDVRLFRVMKMKADCKELGKNVMFTKQAIG